MQAAPNKLATMLTLSAAVRSGLSPLSAKFVGSINSDVDASQQNSEYFERSPDRVRGCNVSAPFAETTAEY